MKVSCPKCNTTYELADQKIKKDRMKMRCSRCQHAFYLVRKPSSAPQPADSAPQAGFEEFTSERPGVPPEFEQIKKQQEGFEEFSSLDAAVPGEFQDLQQTNPQPPAAPQPAPAPQAPQAPPVAAAGTIDPTSGIYETSVSAWDLTPSLIIDAPDIEDTESAPESKTTRRAGQIMFSLVVATIVFFLFVAARNDWSLNFDALPDQIAGAFSSSPKSDIPEIAQGLTISVSEKRLLESGPPRLVLKGEVTNETGEPRQEILLRGRLRDLTDTVIAEVKAPCDIILDEAELASSAPGAHRKKYVRSGALYNCRLNVDGSTIFQLVFENLPDGFVLADHNVSAQVISAKP